MVRQIVSLKTCCTRTNNRALLHLKICGVLEQVTEHGSTEIIIVCEIVFSSVLDPFHSRNCWSSDPSIPHTHLRTF